MAKVSFPKQSEYFAKLQQMEQVFAKDATIERAVHAGAAVVADTIRANLEDLPEEDFRKLQEGETFRGIPKGQKEDLLDSFGLTSISRDKAGFVHTKAGFDGYGSHPTNAYPDGVPNQLIARAVESGSSVRQKMPFVRSAVNASRRKAVTAMENTVDGELKKIF